MKRGRFRRDMYIQNVEKSDVMYMYKSGIISEIEEYEIHKHENWLNIQYGLRHEKKSALSNTI
jgi:hypothetical protein